MPITKTQIWTINNLVKEIATATRISTILVSQGADEEQTEKALKTVLKNPVEKLNEIVNTVKETK